MERIGVQKFLTGTILISENNKKSHTIYVKAKEGETLEEGDVVQILVTARSNDVYDKEISAIFKYTITAQETEFEIKDRTNERYATLILKNTSIADSDVTLEFDPEVLRLDLTDDIYTNRKSMETTTIGEGEFLSKITFVMKGESSKNIRFYKTDITKNYTYPNGNAKSPITFTKN